MLIYNYDPVTGRLLGATPADPDPEQPGAFLFPAFSTPKEPPTAPEGYAPAFDRTADAWRLQALPPAPPPTTAPEPADVDAATQAKAQRDALLRASDWVVLRAYERGEPVPDAWATYRQALRDLTAQEGFPEVINWPQAPTE